jgi:NodT family efflux transporter outer membrane factor (OMF) lipoprotein
MKRIRFWMTGIMVVGLPGCMVGPNYHTPSTTMPSSFSAIEPSTRPTTQVTTQPAIATASTRPVDIAKWWQSFDDPELDSLVDRAITTNFDLEIALTRLQEARTMEVAVNGRELPVAGASGAAGRGSGTNSTKGRISAPLNAGSNTTGLKEITQVVGFDAGWELDLFGRYRREAEAAGYDMQAAAENRNAVLIAVVSDVARAYMDLRAFQMRLSIIQDNIRIEQQSVNVVQQRFDRGITNELDLALAKRQLATLQSQLAPLEDQIVVAQRRLTVLLGTYPDALNEELSHPVALPQVPEQIQTGLPVDLLRRRPDILEAERQLASSTAQVGALTANLFPRLGITAGLGLQGQGLGREPAKNTFLWSVGPTAYWPLLDFGTLDALIDVQDLRTHELLVDYKRSIVNAITEVENSISGYDAEQNRLANLADALLASNRAATLASERYDRGLTDFLNVLDAERQLYELQDQYAVAQETAILQFISLYKGLGGGWENYQNIPPIRRPQPAIIATVERILSPQDPER